MSAHVTNWQQETDTLGDRSVALELLSGMAGGAGMVHYQLRVPRGTGIDEIIRLMSEDGWRALEPYLISQDDPPAHQRLLYEQIFQTLEAYIHAFDLCGTSTICSDEVEGAPWLDYDDNIYILDIPENLEVLVDNIAFTAMESIADQLKPNNRRRIFTLLQRIFYKRLSAYLYHNPVCRNSEFCKLSAPVTPWRQ